jgi:hypothetical protein
MGARPRCVQPSPGSILESCGTRVAVGAKDVLLVKRFDREKTVSLERRDLALDCGDMGRYADAKNIDRLSSDIP